MPRYVFKGSVTVDAEFVIDAEDEADAWQAIDDHFVVEIKMIEYEKTFEPIDDCISDHELTIGRE